MVFCTNALQKCCDGSWYGGIPLGFTSRKEFSWTSALGCRVSPSVCAVRGHKHCQLQRFKEQSCLSSLLPGLSSSYLAVLCRCNSEVKYDSEKHYRDDIFYGPIPTVTTYSETIIAAPNCTWRNYKSQLIFEPRQKPLRFQSTTIIFPKRAKNIYRTTLNYSLGCAKRWFASSVQLELCEETSPCVIYSETL